ncbi:MAG TPA: hypothetical protein VGK41_05505 [Solirubrobacterales bacterium]
MAGLAVSLHDGPAAGFYETHFERAPEELTAVTSTLDGAASVLDLPEDMPTLGENVHAYRLVGHGHMCGRGAGGCLTVAHYELTKEPWQAFTPLRAVPDPD